MLNETLKRARILIVDDQEANIVLLEEMLTGAGYTAFRSVTDPRRALSSFVDYKPDLMLLDLHMPQLDGFAIMERLTPLLEGGSYFPILVLTADVSKEAKHRALTLGAKDFLVKPLDATEVLLRVRNLLETRLLHLQLQEETRQLEARVRQRTRDLEETRVQILRRLARAAEFRDDVTGQHTQRVGELAAGLGTTLGLPMSEVEMIRLAAPLHDVGKISIPDRILLKPAALTSDEFEVMKTHTTIGAELLSGSGVPLLELAEAIALTHHERWDGRGYPHGLQEDGIPMAGRIVAVADTYDTLTHDRPYHRAVSSADALAILEQGVGGQWDPAVVRAMLSGKHGSQEAGMPTSSPLAPFIGDRSPRVLIVDDDLASRQLLVAYLTRWGCWAQIAPDGARARALAREVDPDLILLDIMMPGTSGIAVCDALREDPATSHIPVIFVTGLSGQQVQDLGARVGAEDFVTKPVDPADLAARLGARLRQKYADDGVRQARVQDARGFHLHMRG